MTLPPLTPQKTYFFENFQILAYFQVSSKSRFFRGLKGGHGLQTFYKVLKYMGWMVLSFLGPKVVLFYEIIGGGGGNRVNRLSC